MITNWDWAEAHPSGPSFLTTAMASPPSQDVGHADHLDQRALQLENPQRRSVAVVVGTGTRVPDYPHLGARVGRRRSGEQHAAVGRNTGQHERPAADLGRQVRAPLAERGRVQGRSRLAGELVHELIHPRVRRLKRERPLGVVRAPSPIRNLRSHEPGKGHPGPERLDQALDRAHDLSESRGQPRTVRLGEHSLHVDDRQPGRRFPGATGRGDRRARHTWAAAGSSGAASCARTAERAKAQVTMNPMASATRTPRLANSQAPVLPPRPNGPSRYPCHFSQLALPLVTSPQPMTVLTTITPVGNHRMSPYRPRGLYRSVSA